MTIGSLNIHLPPSTLLPGARGAAVANGGSVAEREAGGRNQQFVPEAEALQTSAETRRIRSLGQTLEPVLELEDLPSSTRNALSTYINAQNAIALPEQNQAAESQSIVGVDLFV